MVRELRQLVGRLARASMRVDRDALGDDQHPRPKVVGVAEPVVRAERSEERLLERVVGALAAEPAAEESQHLGRVLGVERLERRDRRHGIHHPVKRSGVARVRRA